MLSAKGARLRCALVDLLYGDAARTAQATAVVCDAEAWDDVLALAAQWRVLGALRPKLERIPGLAPHVRSRLHELATAAAAHSAMTLHRAVRAAAILEEAGIVTVAFKGVAALVQLYGTPAARLVGDFDCLVPERAARAAERVLLAAGFTSTCEPFDVHVGAVVTSPRLHNHSRTYERDGFELDVHWRIGVKPPPPLRTARLLERSTVARMKGGSLRVPHPIDAQLLTVQHAMRGSFFPGTTLKDASDLDAWWRLRPDAWDVGEAIRAAHAAGLGGSLFALWHFLVTHDSAHPAAAGLERMPALLPKSEIEAGRHLSGFFEAQLRRGEYSLRTTELLVPLQLVVGAAAKLHRRYTARTEKNATVAQLASTGRIAGFARRSLRVTREILDVRQFRAYVAVARTQRRFR